MRAVVGRQEVQQWLGRTLHNALVCNGVNSEHAELGTARKCSAQFEHFKCARAHGHDGFHFSRTVVDGDFQMTAVWQKG